MAALRHDVQHVGEQRHVLAKLSCPVPAQAAAAGGGAAFSLLLPLLLLPTLCSCAGLTEAMPASWQSQWLFSASSNATDLDEPSDICLHSLLSRLSKPKRVLCASASCLCSSATCPRVLPLP
jgi:hypothetical protein